MSAWWPETQARHQQEARIAYAAGYLCTSKAFSTDKTIFCQGDRDVLERINSAFGGAGVIVAMDKTTWALAIADQKAVEQFYDMRLSMLSENKI